MKKYEKPVVMINEELAEGVYAASGQIANNNCWVINHIIPNKDGNTIGENSSVQVAIRMTHTNPENHHTSPVLTIIFDQVITSVTSDSGFANLINSNTIEVTRFFETSNAGPEVWEFNIHVVCENPSALAYSSASVVCPN